MFDLAIVSINHSFVVTANDIKLFVLNFLFIIEFIEDLEMFGLVIV